MDLDFTELFRVYLAEAEESLGSMESGLLQLEQQPDETSHVDLVFRAAHTIKGNSASLGFNALAEYAHEIEDLLDGVRSGKRPVTGTLVSTLLRSVDTLRAWMPALELGTDSSMNDAQRAELAKLRAMKDGGGDVAPVAFEPIELSSATASQARTIRVDADRMDALVNFSGELAVAMDRLRRRVDALSDDVRGGVSDSCEHAERILRDLHESVMRCRMLPLGSLFRRHQRTVRDLARSSSKQVQLVIEGGDVEADMTVIEALTDPLVHMIRNAVDHGIENPQDRVAAGKSATGTISIRAHHDRGSIVIEIADDGRGIHRERIVRKAESLGLPTAGLTDSDLVSLIFEPGFSTSESVTETSGRGVGMDVVRRKIEEIRGLIHVDSEEGRGTTIRLRLPLTLAVIPGFAVGVGGSQFILPMTVVDECLDRDLSDVAETSGVMNVRGEAVPWVRLRSWFGFDTAKATREVVVVVEHDRRRAALVVDEVLGESQTVIKPLGPMFRNVAGITGSAVVGDGSVALVLDSAAIFRQLEKNIAAA